MLLLLLSLTLFSVRVNFAGAAAVTEVDTFFSVILAPTTVGVGQPVLVTLQIDKVNPLSTMTTNLWQGLMCKITKPDGTVETRGPFTAYSMANYFFIYTPTMEGAYTFEGSFPGQWVNGSYRTINTYGAWSNASSLPLVQASWWYKPSSAKATLMVQKEQIPSYPNIPLPTDVWKRPLNAEIKNWWTIADNWLMPKYDDPSDWRFSAAAFAPYTSAPNSPHILWTKPITFGGVVGGQYGDETYRTGLSYEPYYSDAVIINGRIIYGVHSPAAATIYGAECLDLYTGARVWYKDGVDFAFGQILKYDSGNEHGEMAYLWSITGSTTNSTWQMYNAFDGQLLLTITNVTGSQGGTRFGPNGELLSYTLSVSGNNAYLTMWNSTLAICGRYNDYFNPAYQATIDGRRGIQWNVSVPYIPNSEVSAINVKENIVLVTYRAFDVYPFIYGQMALPALIQPDSAGNYPTTVQPLWIQNRTNLYTHRQAYTNIQDGVFAFWDQATRQFHGYDAKTGRELWATEAVPMGWGIFTAGTYIAYGKLYSGFYDGHVRAYDIKTGKLVWDYYMGDAGYENAYATWPAYGFTIADGKIYVSNDEHSPDAVLWRGAKLTVLDAETGKLLWSIPGRIIYSYIADGILTAQNIYDMQIYTFGRGPSATTVSAPNIAVPKGTSVLIQGTVTDQSPGRPGTPCVSKDSMADLMAYLYMQWPIPANVTGVPVKLSAVAPDGSIIDIGTTVTDGYSGTYGYAWTPPKEGQYRITATFEGDESYGSSFATTYLLVGPAPSASIMPTASQPPASSPPPSSASPSVPPAVSAPSISYYIIAGVAVAIVAVALAASLLLRKRKSR